MILRFIFSITFSIIVCLFCNVSYAMDQQGKAGTLIRMEGVCGKDILDLLQKECVDSKVVADLDAYMTFHGAASKDDNYPSDKECDREVATVYINEVRYQALKIFKKYQYEPEKIEIEIELFAKSDFDKTGLRNVSVDGIVAYMKQAIEVGERMKDFNRRIESIWQKNEADLEADLKRLREADANLKRLADAKKYKFDEYWLRTSRTNLLKRYEQKALDEERRARLLASVAATNQSLGLGAAKTW